MIKLKLNINKFISIALLLFGTPLLAFAAVGTGSAYFYDFKSFVYFAVYTMFNPLMYIISGLIFIYFFLGVAKYIWHGGDTEKMKEGYTMLVHGVIAITVSMSIWGIVYFLMNSFGFYAPRGSYSSYPAYSPTQGSYSSYPITPNQGYSGYTNTYRIVPTNNPYDPTSYK